MKQAPKPIETIEDISDVTRFCDGGKYIFRGENKDYGRGIGGKVTSGLYRQYSDAKLLTEQDNFSILDEQEKIIKGARKHLSDGASDIEVLTALQHYGGKTNLIDFTKNLYIALFFACTGKFDDEGQLILMDKATLNNTAINYNEFKEIIQTENILTFPTGKSPRAIFQSSAFVHPRKGYLEQDDYTSVIVNAKLKGKLLLHLRKHHDISAGTVYNDIHGFIQNQSIDAMANEKFSLGLECSTSDDPECAVQYYGEAIKLNPKMLAAYTNRGIDFGKLKRYGDAINEFNKALQIDSRNQDIHRGLAAVYIELSNYEEALTHMRIAKDLYTQKKFSEKAEMLTSAIAKLENVVAEKTRPNTKPTKPKPKK